MLQAAVSQDYIGGLSLSMEEQTVVVAAADGIASLLDMRKSGDRISRMACGAPLRCVIGDGSVAALGKEDGQVGAFKASVLRSIFVLLFTRLYERVH